MKDMDLNKIRKAFEHATPNILDSVLSDCQEQKGTINMTERKTNWNKKLIAVAAALVLVIGLGGGFGWYQYNHMPMADICLDVNPSIQITVSRNEKVMDVDALNKDAEIVLDDMDLEGNDINVAVNAILGSMLKHNYLTVDANTILVSVNSKNAAAGNDLQKKLTEEIGQTLSASDFSGAVMGQTITDDDEISDLAKQYDISEGKVQLIKKILSADSHYTFENLAALSINELKLLTEKETVNLDDVTTSGQASVSEFVGKDAAVNIALSHANATKDQVHELDVELDCDDGRMVYEVAFAFGKYDYEIEVDARSGDILDVDKDQEDIDDDDDDYDDDTPNAASQNYISAKQAKAAAFAHAGISASNAQEIECELDEDDGKVHYNIEFKSGDYEYEYEIDALNGTVISFDNESKRDD